MNPALILYLLFISGMLLIFFFVVKTAGKEEPETLTQKAQTEKDDYQHWEFIC